MNTKYIYVKVVSELIISECPSDIISPYHCHRIRSLLPDYISFFNKYGSYISQSTFINDYIVHGSSYVIRTHIERFLGKTIRDEWQLTQSAENDSDNLNPNKQI
ncbi:unnamed protein product [Rhizophagus irregularis]|uniref:Uncharacterized protein n=1 Tax=Rhizophagus irregularis TaxID=588596 RepID=A0A916E2S6_9GLOM|nr:hypothetical protein OCT59_003372 [Rhizophagus irregularis]GET63789.1 hypothetical protein RIR_jg29515.t1 [Rhizophagus irregularis DAOM 181602=DAOM 197198]CAB4383872.1 unnamed protein product [Rhizophagus irregularis]CAB4407892.1 unnamed protein product [Rhizophagus irregularis]CAB4485841.1 unnamed protein product [Rhizophagus irregularis]